MHVVRKYELNILSIKFYVDLNFMVRKGLGVLLLCYIDTGACVLT